MPWRNRGHQSQVRHSDDYAWAGRHGVVRGVEEPVKSFKGTQGRVLKLYPGPNPVSPYRGLSDWP